VERDRVDSLGRRARRCAMLLVGDVDEVVDDDAARARSRNCRRSPAAWSSSVGRFLGMLSAEVALLTSIGQRSSGR